MRVIELREWLALEMTYDRMCLFTGCFPIHITKLTNVRKSRHTPITTTCKCLGKVPMSTDAILTGNKNAVQSSDTDVLSTQVVCNEIEKSGNSIPQ